MAARLASEAASCGWAGGAGAESKHHPKGVVLGVLNGFLVHKTNKTRPFGSS